MKLRLVIISVGLLVFAIHHAHKAWADHLASYKTYRPQTGQVLNRFELLFKSDPKNELKQVLWQWRDEEGTTFEEYRLNAQDETLVWKVRQPQEKTLYEGRREGNHLLLKGQWKGRPLTKDLPIDARPFYFNPKVGLRSFALSGRPSLLFWAMRHDDLSVYLMKAENKGREMLDIQGKKVETIKVVWTLPDFRSAFFKRTYWFRSSDGLYVKQTASAGTVRVLTGEKNQ